MATRTAGQKEVRHTKDDALDTREFEQLLEATYRLEEYYGLQCRFVVLVAGRLGMRAGEIAHMREGWVDWRRNLIDIPRHQPCDDGRDGGLCGYCLRKAEQKTGHGDEPSLEEAKQSMWSPKTAAGAREIPFGAAPRAEIVIEQFFDRFGAWPHTRQSINRRVDRAAEQAADIHPGDVYPHALRATAASRFAARGLDVFSLKNVMGWSCLSTAQCYVADSGERTARAIRDTMA
jgi:integrase